MSEKIAWPDIPAISKDDPQAEVKKELYIAQLNYIKAKYEADIELEKAKRTELENQKKAQYDNHYAKTQEIYKGYIEVAKGSIDRSIQRADFVQKVAAAVATVYTGVLAFTFAPDASEKISTKLTLSGIIPPVFFGLSFFLSAAYVSFLTRPGDIKIEYLGSSLSAGELSEQNTFISWNKAAVLSRMHLLQASIVSLGIGILLLPIPYMGIPNKTIWWLTGIGLALTILIPLISHLMEKAKKVKPSDIPGPGDIPVEATVHEVTVPPTR